SEDATVETGTEDGRWLITDHGKKYSVRDGGTQLDIYKGGREVAATIVDNYLILEADSTGLDMAINASGAVLEGSISGGDGLGILTAPDTFNHAALQAAADASFTVNGIAITRATNTGLDDVISGVTLDLLSEAESATGTVFDDKTAISSDSTKVTATVTSEVANGVYSVSVNDLAEAHKVQSDKLGDSSEPLGLSGTFTLNGETITVGSGDSTEDIRDAINSANYEIGKELTATVDDQRLVIEADSAGVSNQLSASDTTGTVLSDMGILDAGSFKNTVQTATDASFTVNSVEYTRSSNTDIDDVVDGMTLYLLKTGTEEIQVSGSTITLGDSDDSNGVATLEVAQDRAAISAKINTFVSNLNSTVSYLKAKTETIVNTENKTYTRGALAGNTIFSGLRANLITTLGEEVAGRALSDIGITVGNGLTVSLDSSKLSSELESNFDGVVQLFDGVMAQYLSVLEPYTATLSSSNTLDLYSNSVDTKIDNIDNRIERIEKQLEIKEEALIAQYSGLYMQSMQLQTQQQNLFGLYTSFSTYG
ncbi:flagellar filament capping protein FliD, partial [Candidatus Poribacteria bacterium]